MQVDLSADRQESAFADEAGDPKKNLTFSAVQTAETAVDDLAFGRPIRQGPTGFSQNSRSAIEND
jgi:hypothetical protein